VTYLYATNMQCHYVNYVENCFNNLMQTKSLISAVAWWGIRTTWI